MANSFGKSISMPGQRKLTVSMLLFRYEIKKDKDTVYVTNLTMLPVHTPKEVGLDDWTWPSLDKHDDVEVVQRDFQRQN